MRKKIRCERCGRMLYLDSEGRLRSLDDNSVMCSHPDHPWHKAKG